MAKKTRQVVPYAGLPKLCSVCGKTFYGRDATEGKTGPIICLVCWHNTEMKKKEGDRK